MANLISIGILTRNGGHEFRSVLEVIGRQVCDVPFEIVILDSGSADDTLALARAAGARVNQIPPEDFSFGESRDRLFSLCRGDIIVTISQDASPLGNDWLDLLTKPIRQGRADIVQGWEQMHAKPFFWERIGKFYVTSEWQPFLEQYGDLGLSTVNLAVSRRAWEATGFGPISMCSDKLFQKRVAESGLRVEIHYEALVRHGHQYKLTSLVKRCANEGMALRLLGFDVEPTQTIHDLLNHRIYRTLVAGLLRGHVRAPAEVFFPLIRPLAVLYGNRFLSDYWR